MLRSGFEASKMAALMRERVAVTWKFYFIYALWMLLLFPVHESAHYVGYRMAGVSVRMTLNTVTPYDETQRRAAPELAGPLMNLVVGAVAVYAFYHAKRGHQWWAALALCAALFRLAIYLIVLVGAAVTGSGMGMGNDEPIAASLLHLPSLTFVFLLTPFFLMIVWCVLRDIEGSWLRRSGHLLGLTAVTIGLGVFIGQFVDFWLFPR